MDFRDVVSARRMVRNYTHEPVPAAVVDRIVDAGLSAPSAGFSQGQRLVVVTEPQRRSAIAEAAGEAHYVAKGFDPWISRAPVHIVVCADKDAYLARYSEPDKAGRGGRPSREEDWPVPYWWVDAGATMMALLLAAVDEGLAAGFLGAHALDRIRRRLDIPASILVVGVVTLGHPAPDRRSGSLDRGRIPRTDAVSYETWGSGG